MERRIKYSVGIAVCVIMAVLVFQFLWLSYLYRLESNSYTRRLEELTENAVLHLNVKQAFVKDVDDRLGLSYSAEDNLLVIIPLDGKKIHYSLSREEKMEKVLNRAMYDVRDRKWPVEMFDSIVRADMLSVYEAVVFKVAVRDSLENELEVAGDMNMGRDAGSIYSVPLGYITGRTLNVYYYFPFANFWHKESDRIILAVGLFLLFVIGIYFLIQTILIQKRQAAFREDFMRFIVHDLKSPVNFLKTASFFIREKSASPYTEEQAELYGQSQERFDEVSRNIGHLLTASVDIYGLHLDRCGVNMKEEIEKMMLVSKLGKERSVEMVLDYRLPDTVWADSLHLPGVIGNLLDNAVKYGGESVRISIACYREKKNMIFRVKDNGAGIPQHKIRDVFKRYYRLDRDRTSIKGFGIGLSYVATVVRAYRGNVKIVSENGQGCEFIISLPWKEI